jgi:putative component of membrane protein insertase Oxa1/YidC/SpoIIIJ protein YidD
MQAGSRRIGSLLLRAIDRHRQVRRMPHGVCRFTPTCSHYAEDALRQRVLPVALALIAWRVLRCNPLLTARAEDPVRRRRRRLRPNAVPTAFAVMALSGFVVVTTAAIAEAVGVTGGCSATVNGQDASALTSDHPLVVHKHESVSFDGTAPAAGPNDPNNTDIKVDIIEGIGGVTSSNHPGHGPHWGGQIAVDDYLKYGVGLYHVTGTATGAGFSCAGDGYVRLEDGDPITKPVGAAATALAAIGAGGGLLSSRAAKPDMAPAADTSGVTGDDTSAEVSPADAELRHRLAEDVNDATADGWASASADAGCLVALAIVFFIGFAAHGGAGAVSAMPAAAGAGRRRVWSHGHPIAGFFSGLVLGIGGTVLLQQFAVWPLTIVTAIIVPVVTGLLVGVRSYLGRAYRVA